MANTVTPTPARKEDFEIKHIRVYYTVELKYTYRGEEFFDTLGEDLPLDEVGLDATTVADEVHSEWTDENIISHLVNHHSLLED